jgi:hypothetical protein
LFFILVVGPTPPPSCAFKSQGSWSSKRAVTKDGGCVWRVGALHGECTPPRPYIASSSTPPWSCMGLRAHRISTRKKGGGKGLQNRGTGAASVAVSRK